MKPPECLLHTPWPWNILGRKLPPEIDSRPWDEESGRVAFGLLVNLCKGYESGWPDPTGYRTNTERERIAMVSFRLGTRPTYEDLADPERFRARTTVNPPLSLEEAEALAARRTPSEVRATTTELVRWLGNTPRESHLAPAILDLTRQSWMKVGVWLQLDLVTTVGEIYQEECLPFFSEILDSPAASDDLKRHVNYFGGLIKHPPRREDFMIRDDDPE